MNWKVVFLFLKGFLKFYLQCYELYFYLFLKIEFEIPRWKQYLTVSSNIVWTLRMRMIPWIENVFNYLPIIVTKWHMWQTYRQINKQTWISWTESYKQSTHHKHTHHLIYIYISIYPSIYLSIYLSIFSINFHLQGWDFNTVYFFQFSFLILCSWATVNLYFYLWIYFDICFILKSSSSNKCINYFT